jgi:hypothetical protein
LSTPGADFERSGVKNLGEPNAVAGAESALFSSEFYLTMG